MLQEFYKSGLANDFIKEYLSNTPCPLYDVIRKGDIIDIDFENRNVYVNHERRNDLVNISSRYFNIEKGINNIKIFSNDEQAVVGAAINEAWIGSE